ncbi:hypothetical protein CBS101457_000238 [Exobasidium rhododendri]|nr:hypothetical protein CBS101457_000238 [Exobasidium rhododendri]
MTFTTGLSIVVVTLIGFLFLEVAAVPLPMDGGWGHASHRTVVDHQSSSKKARTPRITRPRDRDIDLATQSGFHTSRLVAPASEVHSWNHESSSSMARQRPEKIKTRRSKAAQQFLDGYAERNAGGPTLQEFASIQEGVEEEGVQHQYARNTMHDQDVAISSMYSQSGAFTQSGQATPLYYDNSTYVDGPQYGNHDENLRYYTSPYDAQGNYVQPEQLYNDDPTGQTYDDVIDFSFLPSDEEEEDPEHGLQYLNIGSSSSPQTKKKRTPNNEAVAQFFNSRQHRAESSYPSDIFNVNGSHHSYFRGNWEPITSVQNKHLHHHGYEDLERHDVDIGVKWSDPNELIFGRMHRQHQDYITELIADKRGFLPKSIKEGLAVTLTPLQAQDFMSGDPARVEAATQLLYPVARHYRAAQNWSRYLNDDEKRTVILKLVEATGQDRDIVRNILLHSDLDPAVAKFMLTVSVEQCRSLAEQYKLFRVKAADQPWRSGLSKDEVMLLYKKLEDAGMGKSSFYKYLKRHNIEGIGQRLLYGSEEEFHMILRFFRGKGTRPLMEPGLSPRAYSKKM